MILDATAGNRNMWKNKNPTNTVFMDKEFGLGIPPDVLADFRYCPFRTGVFNCVIFDPPHYVTPPIWHRNPKGYELGLGRQDEKGFRRGPWWGEFKSKTDMFISIHKAQKEFQRLTNRLCLKWHEGTFTLWKILPLFKDWMEIQRIEHQSPHKKGNKTNRTYWITFIRGSTPLPSSDETQDKVIK